jgi:hypothetical protein
MSRAQEQFRKLNERLLPDQKIPGKMVPLLIIAEMLWIGFIFALIIVGLLSGLLAFAALVAGLIIPAIIIRRLRNKLKKASAPPQPASEQIIDHAHIKTRDDGSPFVD